MRFSGSRHRTAGYRRLQERPGSQCPDGIWIVRRISLHHWELQDGQVSAVGVLLNTELERLETLRQLVHQLFLAPARNLFHCHGYNSGS